MEDARIVQLYWDRSEQAIQETDTKYGRYCYAIAYNILENSEDSEESVSDTYMAAWKAMPPKRPTALALFLGKITRNLSINRWRTRNTNKRGGGQLVLALDELAECADKRQNVEDQYTYQEILSTVNDFLGSLPEMERDLFLRRYWFLDSIADIAQSFQFSQSKVATTLHRTRLKLRKKLEKEGYL